MKVKKLRVTCHREFRSGSKEKRRMSTYHRKCRSNGGKSSSGNMVIVPVFLHTAWHFLFGNKEAPEIARIINEVWLAPEWELVARKRF